MYNKKGSGRKIQPDFNKIHEVKVLMQVLE